MTALVVTAAVFALSDPALAGIVAAVLVILFVIWCVAMTWLDRRREDRETARWRGLP